MAAQPYTGEIPQDIPQEALFGTYERITLVSALPQGIQTAVPMKLGERQTNDSDMWSVK